MSEKSPSAPAPGPGILRQEGPHKVSVSPGATTALSSTSGLGTPRLRPAVGPVPPGLQPNADAAGLAQPELRRRMPGDAARTVVQRIGDSPMGTAPAVLDEPSRAAARQAAASELDRRLGELSRLNAQTSRLVAELERNTAPAEPIESTPNRTAGGLFRRKTA